MAHFYQSLKNFHDSLSCVNTMDLYGGRCGNDKFLCNPNNRKVLVCAVADCV